MKIKKVVLLMFLPILFLSIGMVKVKAWSCIYDYEKSIKDINGKVNFEKKGKVELKPTVDTGKLGFLIEAPGISGQGFVYDSSSWDDSDSCDSLDRSKQYVKSNKGTCVKFKKTIHISSEESCPAFLYELNTTTGGMIFVAGNSDPKNLSWMDTKKLTSTGGIKSRIDNDGQVSTQSQSNSSGAGVSATSGCGIFGKTTTKYIKLANNILRIGGSLLVIALGIIDFLHILLMSDEKVYKTVIVKFIKRLIALVALLLLPYILYFILRISGVLKMYGISDNDIFCVLGF